MLTVLDFAGKWTGTASFSSRKRLWTIVSLLVFTFEQHPRKMVLFLPIPVLPGLRLLEVHPDRFCLISISRMVSFLLSFEVNISSGINQSGINPDMLGTRLSTVSIDQHILDPTR